MAKQPCRSSCRSHCEHAQHEHHRSDPHCHQACLLTHVGSAGRNAKSSFLFCSFLPLSSIDVNAALCVSAYSDRSWFVHVSACIGQSRHYSVARRYLHHMQAHVHWTSGRLRVVLIPGQCCAPGSQCRSTSSLDRHGLIPAETLTAAWRTSAFTAGAGPIQYCA
jgi:hypothetical protein